MSIFDKYIAAGLTAELLPIIPPDAELWEGSKVDASDRGKTPGRFNASTGKWAGLGGHWPDQQVSETEVRRWGAWPGVGVGLQARRFPGLDIDIEDVDLAEQVQALAEEHLGEAPARSRGTARRLLVYRTGLRMQKRRMAFEVPGLEKKQAVELLAHGQQYVIEGIHQSGAAYAWDRPLHGIDPADLAEIDDEAVTAFFVALGELLELYGYEATASGRTGTGSGRKRHPIGAEELLGDVDKVRRALDALPNDFGYDAVIPVLAAIKAALGGDHYELYEAWVLKYPGATPEWALQKWESIHEAELGAEYLYGLARQHGFSDGADYFDAFEPDDDGEEDGPDLAQLAAVSDQTLAAEFASRFRGRLLYVVQRGEWMIFEGGCWRDDLTLQGQALIRTYLRDYAWTRIGGKSKDAKAARKLLLSYGKLASVEKLARTHLAADIDRFDADLWVLNTPAGVVDLRTGGTRPHAPGELFTKITAVAPEGGDPVRFLAFLRQITQGDEEMVDYLQRALGYTLCGDPQEEVIFYLWGPGGNGKSVLLNLVLDILGTYGQKAAMEVFLATKSPQHSTSVARMRGARFVFASEVPKNQAWNESLIRSISGRDRMTARFMRQDDFEFTPQLTLWCAGNDKPKLAEVDAAIERRFHMATFDYRPARPDKELRARLLAEEGGRVLNWLIRGCLAWRQRGLERPRAVQEATEAYFEDNDVVRRWIKDRCRTGARFETPAAELLDSFNAWAGESDEAAMSAVAFARELARKGFQKRKSDGVNKWEGIGLNAAAEAAA